MRSLVTGAAGFIGSSLTDKLLSLGHEVIGIDSFVDYYPRAMKERNLDQARSHNKFRFIEGDLLDLNLNKVCEGVDYVFHQAAQAGVRASWGTNFSIYTNNNILASQRLLEALRSERVRGTLKKIVYASSSSVYGHAETLPTLETALPKPVSPYGVSKLAAEHLMVLYAKEFGVPTVSLRYFTVYGPRQRPDMAFHRFIKAGLTGEEILLFGTGEQSRDFTFIDDIVEANIAAADARFNPAEENGVPLVYNIGGGSRVTVNQVIQQIEELVGSNLKINKQPREAGDAAHTGADTTIAKQHLSYSPAVSLREGLSREVAWLRSLL